jgi:hypothetical protein
MHASIIPLATLLTAALSLPQAAPTRSGPGPWQITNYNPGCGTSPAGCAYSFKISYTPPYSPDTSLPTEPAFSTHCSGNDVNQKDFKACAHSGVSQMDQPGPGESTLLVRHTWTDAEGVTYTETGNATITLFETDGQNFTVVPNQITAIA